LSGKVVGQAYEEEQTPFSRFRSRSRVQLLMMKQSFKKKYGEVLYSLSKERADKFTIKTVIHLGM
jgi:hypothetical protein